MKKQDKYILVSSERYAILEKRSRNFKDILNDVTTDPVRVFDPLGPKHVRELQLIRDISKELQSNKDEDMKKARQAAEQAEQERKAEEQKIAAEAKEEQTEEKKEE